MAIPSKATSKLNDEIGAEASPFRILRGLVAEGVVQDSGATERVVAGLVDVAVYPQRGALFDEERLQVRRVGGANQIGLAGPSARIGSMQRDR